MFESRSIEHSKGEGAGVNSLIFKIKASESPPPKLGYREFIVGNSEDCVVPAI